MAAQISILRAWIEALRQPSDVRFLKVLETRSAIRRGLLDCNDTMDRTIERLIAALG